MRPDDASMDAVLLPKRIRSRIAAGRPKPLTFSNSILLSPESVLLLDGKSMRGQFEKAGKLSLLRGVERVQRLGLENIPSKVSKGIAALAAKAPPSPFRDLFIRAFSMMEPAAQTKISELGLWGMFHGACFEPVPVDALYWTTQFVEIANASKQADSLMAVWDFAGTSAALSNNSLLRHNLTDRALESLADAKSDVDALPSRFAGAMEVLLSNVARMDIETRKVRQSDESFEWLFLAGQDGRCNPGRQFTRRLVERLGPGTLEGFLAQASDPCQPNREFVDLATVKRWNGGLRFPSRDKIGPLLRSILKARLNEVDAAIELERFGNAYGSARRIHKALELVSMCDARPMPDGRATGVLQLLGSDSAESWVHTRYPYWLKHRRSHETEAQTGHALAYPF